MAKFDPWLILHRSAQNMKEKCDYVREAKRNRRKQMSFEFD